jgi:hypothetical protein
MFWFRMAGSASFTARKEKFRMIRRIPSILLDRGNGVGE